VASAKNRQTLDARSRICTLPAIVVVVVVLLRCGAAYWQLLAPLAAGCCCLLVLVLLLLVAGPVVVCETPKRYHTLPIWTARHPRREGISLQMPRWCTVWLVGLGGQALQSLARLRQNFLRTVWRRPDPTILFPPLARKRLRLLSRACPPIPQRRHHCREIATIPGPKTGTDRPDGSLPGNHFYNGFP
jgi:hypothetical protein